MIYRSEVHSLLLPHLSATVEEKEAMKSQLHRLLRVILHMIFSLTAAVDSHPLISDGYVQKILNF